jgi:drug/metabolite transporter (DMT)-like permease
MSAHSAGFSARSLLAFVLTTLIWGSTWLAIKGQLGQVPPDWSVVWRFLISAAGMFALAIWRGQPLWMPRPVMIRAFWVGMLQFCGNYVMVYRAEEHLTSGLVAIIFALLMIPNAVFGWIFLRATVRPRFVAGSAVALAGIALLMINEYRMGPLDGSVLLGFVFAGTGLLLASGANVLQASAVVREYPMFVQIAWAMLFGALADAVIALAVSGPPQIALDAMYLGTLFYLALIGSVAAFPLYFLLIREWGPGRAAYNGVAIPVVAMALSTLFEHFRWTTLAIGGAVLAMLGLIIALTGRKQAREPVAVAVPARIPPE